MPGALPLSYPTRARAGVEPATTGSEGTPAYTPPRRGAPCADHRDENGSAEAARPGEPVRSIEGQSKEPRAITSSRCDQVRRLRERGEAGRRRVRTGTSCEALPKEVTHPSTPQSSELAIFNYPSRRRRERSGIGRRAGSSPGGRSCVHNLSVLENPFGPGGSTPPLHTVPDARVCPSPDVPRTGGGRYDPVSSPLPDGWPTG